jgi:hypothetical protein
MRILTIINGEGGGKLFKTSYSHSKATGIQQKDSKNSVMRNNLDEWSVGVQFGGSGINHLNFADDPTLRNERTLDQYGNV